MFESLTWMILCHFWVGFLGRIFFTKLPLGVTTAEVTVTSVILVVDWHPVSRWTRWIWRFHPCTTHSNCGYGLNPRIFLFLPGSHAIYDYTPQSPVPQCNRDMQLFLALLESIDLVLNALHPNISAYLIVGPVSCSLTSSSSRTSPTQFTLHLIISYLYSWWFQPQLKNTLVNLCQFPQFSGWK